MKWFEGSIPSAIQEAKSRNAVFVVYITGEDDISKEMDETWSDKAVMAECNKENLVVIRVEANSETCGQFSAIYPVVCVPSTFFIGDVGVPLEIIGGHKPPEEFVGILQKVVQVHKSKATASPQPSSGAGTSAAAADGAPSESGASAAQVDTVPAAGEPQPSSSQTVEEVSKEEKLRRAREVMEQKRIQKAEEEKEKSKKEELERRKVGQDLQKLSNWKDEMNAKETQAQLKKDREEEKKAKDRVREQIAQDRAERAARFKKDKTERELIQQEKERAKLVAQQEALAKDAARRSELSRVQFRLSDGSTITHQFASTDPLQNARDFVAQHLGRSPTSFTLSTTFPRRRFADSDMCQSMADLGLAPTAVIVVLPGSQSSPGPSRGDTDGGILSLILAPFLYIWSMICSIFFGGRQQPVTATPQPSSSAQTDASQTASASQTNPSGAYQRPGRTLRPEGNIHRLTDSQRKDDDDTATWNGNSTQQM